MLYVSSSFSGGEYFNYFNLVRGSTNIFVGNASGSVTQCTASVQSNSASNMMPIAIEFLDSPATTSATTYKIQYQVQSGGTLYINQYSGETNSAVYCRTASSITVMEVS